MIDTNILVYDTFKGSIYHGSAVRLLDELDRWLIPLIVVYEYIWFLKGLSVDAGTALTKVLEYMESEKALIIREEPSGVRWALTTIVEERLSLSRFNDKIVLYTAIRRSAPLATYDAKLRQQAVKHGVTVLPEKL